jgi:hypothetical protein
MRRTLRYDGVVAQVSDAAGIAAIAEWVARERPAAAAERPFEIVAQGTTPADPVRASEVVGAYAEAGATWWIDADWDGGTVEVLRRRIGAGPPRLSGGMTAEP